MEWGSWLQLCLTVVVEADITAGEIGPFFFQQIPCISRVCMRALSVPCMQHVRNWMAYMWPVKDSRQVGSSRQEVLHRAGVGNGEGGARAGKTWGKDKEQECEGEESEKNRK